MPRKLPQANSGVKGTDLILEKGEPDVIQDGPHLLHTLIIYQLTISAGV